MKRVHIDFAAPSLARTLHRTHPAAWLLALCALALCGAALALGWQLHQRESADQRKLAAVRVR
ncbi:MAG: hypothetical protein ABIT83_08250, partial [Massilia sp.]